MGYFITYVAYGSNKKMLSINIWMDKEDAEKEAAQLRSCGHKYVEIRTGLFDEYCKMYEAIM